MCFDALTNLFVDISDRNLVGPLNEWQATLLLALGSMLARSGTATPPGGAVAMT